MPAPIDNRVRKILADLVADPSNLEQKAPDLLKLLIMRLNEQGLGDLAPSIAWMYPEVKKLRELLVEDDWLDGDWSLALLGDKRISVDPNGIRSIESVRRLAKIGRRPFTIRQALWTARLRPLIPCEASAFWRTWFTYYYADLMAREEVAAYLLESDLDSSAIESLWTFYGEKVLHDSSPTGSWTNTISDLARDGGFVTTSLPRKTEPPSEIRNSVRTPPMDVFEPESDWLLDALAAECPSPPGRYIELLDEIGYEAVLLALRSLEAAGRFNGTGHTDRDRVGEQLCAAAFHKEHDQFQEILQRETLICENVIKEATDGN